MLLLSGCIHTKYENALRLMDRPNFAAAAESAPEWVRDALKTVNSLEHELEII